MIDTKVETKEVKVDKYPTDVFENAEEDKVGLS